LQTCYGSDRSIVRVAEKELGVNGVLPSEARRAASGDGALGEEAASPSPPERGLGSAVSFPGGGTLNDFSNL